MGNKKATLRTMKSSNVNIRLSDDLRPVVDYLKLLPGGLTKWFEDRLREVTVDKVLLERLNKLK